MAKNFILGQKTNQKIRGDNSEAKYSIIFFAIFIAASFVLAFTRPYWGRISLMGEGMSMAAGLLCLLASLYISGRSLIDLKDSWRVGVLENQQSELITSGIYRFTRNPYFLSYLLMFLGYAILLQNILLFIFLVPTIILIHLMILKEENYLIGLHGRNYTEYKNRVPRYLIF